MPNLPAIHQRIIETKRLLLKELTPEMQDVLFTSCTDQEIMSFLGFTTSEELETERGKWKGGMTTYRSSFKSFFVWEKDSGKMIGRSGFHNWYPMHRRAELGYVLFDEAARQKGYMTEAVQAIIAYGFDEMDLNRIEAFASPANMPSVKILKGAGFTEEGLLRSHFFKDGVIEDSACFGLLQHEYRLVQK